MSRRQSGTVTATRSPGRSVPSGTRAVTGKPRCAGRREHQRRGRRDARVRDEDPASGQQPQRVARALVALRLERGETSAAAERQGRRAARSGAETRRVRGAVDVHRVGRRAGRRSPGSAARRRGHRDRPARHGDGSRAAGRPLRCDVVGAPAGHHADRVLPVADVARADQRGLRDRRRAALRPGRPRRPAAARARPSPGRAARRRTRARSPRGRSAGRAAAAWGHTSVRPEGSRSSSARSAGTTRSSGCHPWSSSAPDRSTCPSPGRR